jgi:hypothetical protein
MSTESQVNANRRNAQSSTGPRTPEGKSISSGNATKHGLSAAFRVLPNEDQQAFDESVAGFQRDFQPTNSYEQFLVEEMAQARWRVARIRRFETAVIEQMLGVADPADTDVRIASRFLRKTADPLLVLQRHAAAAERSGRHALKQLLALRKLEAQAARDRARQNEPNSSEVEPPTRGKGERNGGSTGPATPPPEATPEGPSAASPEPAPLNAP